MSTKIEWANETWNPVTGCTPVSEGCAHCYARRMAQRLAGRYGYPADEPFTVTPHRNIWDRPLHWDKPRRVFVCSMGDLFHSDVHTESLEFIFAAMSLAHRHTFMVLTKRPERMRWALTHSRFIREVRYIHAINVLRNGYNAPVEMEQWPLPNVWLGVTAENQARADERIPILLQIPAERRFVSVEPMLGPVNLQNDLGIWTDGIVNPHQWLIIGQPMTPHLFTAMAKPKKATLYKKQLDWVICGAETGPGARPMNLDWARSLRDQCVEAGIPFFFKRGSDGSRELDGQLWEQYPNSGEVGL